MAKGTLYYILAIFTFILCSYTIHIVIARHMGPAIYGVFGIVFSVFSVIDLFVRGGLGRAVSKFVAEENWQFGVLRSALRLQLIISTAFTLIFFLGSNLVASLLEDESLGFFFRLSSLCIIPYAFVSIYNGYLNGLREFGREAISSISYSIIKLLFVLLFLVTGFGVGGIVTGYAISACIAVVISRQFAIPFMKNWAEPLLPAKTLLLFATPVAFVSINEVFLMNIDTICIKRILQDDTLTGLYISAVNLARIPWHIHGAFYMTLFPSISLAMSRGNNEFARGYIAQSLRYVIIVIVPISLIINISSANLLRLFYSEAFVHASVPLSILVFGISLMSIFILLTGIISASGSPYCSFLLSFILVPISIAGNFILIPKYGLLGGAMASTIAYGFGLVFAGSFVFVRFGRYVNMLSLLRITVGCFAIVVTVKKEPTSPINMLVSYLLSVVGYFSILFIIREITIKDMNVFKGLAKKLLRSSNDI
jgi:O-antigen/teichoic acid export membrane protein